MLFGAALTAAITSLVVNAAVIEINGPPQSVRVWQIEGKTFAFDPEQGVVDLDHEPAVVILRAQDGTSIGLSSDGRFAVQIERDGHRVTGVTRRDLLGQEVAVSIPLPVAPPVFEVSIAPVTGWVVGLTSKRPPTGPPLEPRLRLLWPASAVGPDRDVSGLQWTDDGRHLLLSQSKAGALLLGPDLTILSDVSNAALTTACRDGSILFHTIRGNPTDVAIEGGGMRVAALAGREVVTALAVSPNGQYFAIARGGQIANAFFPFDRPLAPELVMDVPEQVAKLLVSDTGRVAALFCREDPETPGRSIPTAARVSCLDGRILAYPMDRLAAAPSLPTMNWRQHGTIEVNAGARLILLPVAEDEKGGKQ